MRVLISFCFVLFISTLKSQDSALIVIRYKLTYVIDTTQPKYPDIAYFSLLIGKHESKFTDFVDNNSNVVYTTAISRQDIYKNFSNSKLNTEIRMGQAVYAVIEEIPVINWLVGKEHKIIQGYNCQSATGFYRGRNYTAWFSSKIPFRNGPWKFGGLPGVILEIYDEKREIIWESQNISTQIDASVKLIQLNRNDINVTSEEFRKLKEAIRKDPGAMRGAVPNVTPQKGVIVTVVPAASMGSGNMHRKFNNPIEKN